MRLEKVKAIVTGAASGLGRCFALELARAGAAVAAGDIDVAGLARLKAECEDLPGRLLTGKLDITQENSVVAFVAEVAEEFGGVNVLVNNAGILRDGVLARGEAGWVKKLPTMQWRQVIDVNLTGQYLMAREVAADILKRETKEGVFVNISSISNAGKPGQSNYAASKAGLDACTRTWALELAGSGVRVGGIAPGVIETPILKNISDEAKEHLLDSIPLGRFGVPEEVWQALRFIIECDYFTGRIIYVDGGSNF
ncbi:MAG TPA: SDR family oxidoreductase [Pyrinomonadaceae bacterium]|jgi:3-oxoacyl-[acyl-carrier protein] reductase|nr:SDR family oxidoreductase [Pyrinomonadaceae bacterium]